MDVDAVVFDFDGVIIDSRDAVRTAVAATLAQHGRESRPPEELDAAGWTLPRPPFLLETSRPGVFAVGDVRAGNIKRVASAVGEGSIAIAFVHQALQRA